MLYDNALNGTIPTTFSGLKSVTYLYAYNNQLTGSIPSVIGELGSLIYLHLDTNMLTGTIPPELGSLHLLEELYLQTNSLRGSLPSTIGAMHSLVDLNVDSNMMTGTVPSSLFSLGKSLTGLGISDNLFSGTIPTELVQLTLLTKVEVISPVHSVHNMKVDSIRFAWCARPLNLYCWYHSSPLCCRAVPCCSLLWRCFDAAEHQPVSRHHPGWSVQLFRPFQVITERIIFATSISTYQTHASTDLQGCLLISNGLDRITKFHLHLPLCYPST